MRNPFNISISNGLCESAATLVRYEKSEVALNHPLEDNSKVDMSFVVLVLFAEHEVAGRCLQRA